MNLEENKNKIICGDALQVLQSFPSESIDCCITSPPYWNLRDYESVGQLGREKTYTEYLDKLVEIFNEVKRTLKNTGSLWVVIADSYTKQKNLANVPERFCIDMVDKAKWTLRSKIIWWKRNATPHSAKDRFTPDYEYVLFFTKSAKGYYFKTQYEPHNPKYEFRYKSPFGGKRNKSGQGAFNYSEPRFLKPNPLGRIKRCVWDVPVETLSEIHFATYPRKLIETPILATCPEDGIVLDPFMGSGTTALVAVKNFRKFIGIELNQKNVELAYTRLRPLMLQQTLII